MTAETSIYEYAKNGLMISADKTALWFYGRSITYRELFSKIDNVSDNLYALGVREGTVVTIHLPNCPQAVIAIYAVARLGGICNMVHAQTPAAALRENMTFTESDVLITYLPDCTGTSKTSLYVDISYHMGSLYRAGVRFRSRLRRPAGTVPFEMMERGCGERAIIPDQGALAGKCAVYMHSSGTTGKPKTILLSHSALNNCVDNTADFFENGDMSEQVSLGALPPFHGFGFEMDIHRNISFGSQLVMMTRWNARSAVKLIKKHNVTLIVGVPTMFHMLLNEPGFHGRGISRLSKCYVGGDNIDPDLIERFDNRIDGTHRMFAGFGLTEATTTNCVNTYLHYKTNSVGYAVRNTAIAVLNKDGKLSLTGEGELVISSRTLMIGYLKDPEATEKTLFLADGKRWVRSGDMVEIDEDGFLFFKDRIKNIIISNGYNIYPDHVEDVIRRIPSVDDVCVVGAEDDKLHTQSVRAVVILKPGAEQVTAEKQIRRECSRILPRYSLPKEIIFTDAFPVNSMGKVDRKELSKS